MPIEQDSTRYAYLVERFQELNESGQLGRTLIKLAMSGGEEVVLAMSAQTLSQLLAKSIPALSVGSQLQTNEIDAKRVVRRARASVAARLPEGNAVTISFVFSEGDGAQFILSERAARVLSAKLVVSEEEWRS